MRSSYPVYTVLLTLVGLFAGAVWLTYNPDHQLLTAARDWPVVGPAAAALQDTYRPSAPAPTPSSAPPTAATPRPKREVSRTPATHSPDQPLAADDPRIHPPTLLHTGQRADADDPGAVRRMVIDGEVVQYDVPEVQWLRRGVVLLHEPRDGAKPVLELDNPAPLAILDRRGEWAQMRAGSYRGWVRLNDENLHHTPPRGSAPQPVTALPGRVADPERLERAIEQLTAVRPGLHLGPYPLFTDVDDVSLLQDLDVLAQSLETSYRQRFGVGPRDQPRESIVLYADPVAYRAYRAQESRLAGVDSVGHAGHGMAVLYTGQRHRDEITATLSHELAHLLNRRAVGPALPPWLDEGLAEAFAQGRRRADGSLDNEELSGLVTSVGTRRTFSGARASLELLERRRRDGALLPLHQLVTLDWQRFVASDRADLAYSQSAFFIRWLLADNALRPLFQRFLADTSEGAPMNPESLRLRLGRSWQELDAGFAAYIERSYSTLGGIDPES